jgi:hypothetical protein
MRLWLFALLPLWMVPLLFVAVLRSGDPPAPLVRQTLPDEPFVTDRCTWSCHNHGCSHTPKLPAVLTSDRALFGWTIRALYTFGERLVPGNPFVGYGAANLVVFCAVWPGAMFALFVIGLRQRERLRALQRSAS